MAASIRIQETRKPSYVNRSGLTGALLATTAILALAASFIVPNPVGALAAMQANTAITAITGIVSGALIGACAMLGAERERQGVAMNHILGRVVQPPTMINRGMTLGLLKGAALGLAAVTGLALLGAATVPLGFIGGMAIGATGWWAHRDATQEYGRMAMDYYTAKVQLSQSQPQKSRGLGDLLGGLVTGKSKNGVAAQHDTAPKAPAREDKVTLADMAELNSRLKAGRKSALQQAEATREKAAALGR